MGALAKTEAQRLLSNSLRDGTKTYVLGLFLTSPTKEDSGMEASGGNYARTAIAFGAPSEVGGKQVVSNIADVDFGVQTASLGTVAYWGVYDNSGALKFFGQFSSAKTIAAGDAVEVAAGDIDCILS